MSSEEQICLKFLANPGLNPQKEGAKLMFNKGPFQGYVALCRKHGYNKEVDELLNNKSIISSPPKMVIPSPKPTIIPVPKPTISSPPKMVIPSPKPTIITVPKPTISSPKPTISSLKPTMIPTISPPKLTIPPVGENNIFSEKDLSQFLVDESNYISPSSKPAIITNKSILPSSNDIVERKDTTEDFFDISLEDISNVRLGTLKDFIVSPSKFYLWDWVVKPGEYPIPIKYPVKKHFKNINSARTKIRELSKIPNNLNDFTVKDLTILYDLYNKYFLMMYFHL